MAAIVASSSLARAEGPLDHVVIGPRGTGQAAGALRFGLSGTFDDPLASPAHPGDEGATLAGLMTFGVNVRARDIADWAFCNAQDCGRPDGIPVSRDAVRGVAVAPAGSTIDLVNAIGGYVDNKNPDQSGAPFPVSVALFGLAVSDADHAKSWGINTVCSDGRYLITSSGLGRSCNNEFDINLTSPRSTGTGLLLGGSTTVQPASATAVNCASLDNKGGLVAKWTACFYALDGATRVFAHVGTASSTGSNIAGQIIQYGYIRSDGKAEQISWQAQPGGTGNWGTSDPDVTNVIQYGTQIFSAPSVKQAIAFRAGLHGSSGQHAARSQKLEFDYDDAAGHLNNVTLGAEGGSLPLLRLVGTAGAYLEVESGLMVSGHSGVSCSGAPSPHFAAVGGIITHC